MSRAGFVLGLLVMVQGVVGQTPVVVNHYVPSMAGQPLLLEDPGVYQDVPASTKVVNVPTGQAVITWNANWEIGNSVRIRPVGGGSAPSSGISTQVGGAGPGRPLSGSWATAIEGGQLEVKLQADVFDLGTPLQFDSRSYVTWTLVVYPDFPSNVPAIGGIGLLVMVAGLLAAGGFMLRRRARTLSLTRRTRW